MDSEIRKRQFLEESWIIKTRHEYGEYSSEARKEVFGNWFMWGASRFIEFYLNYLKDPKDNEKKKTFTESFEKRSSRLYEHEIYGVERFEEALAFLDPELLRTVDYDYQNAVRSFWGSDPFYNVPIEENGKKVMRIRYPDAALIQKREKQFSYTLDKYKQLCQKALFPTEIQDQPSLEAQNFFKSNGLNDLFERLVRENSAKWQSGKLNYMMPHGEFKDIIQNKVPDFNSWTALSSYVLHKGKKVTSNTLNKSYKK